LGNDINKKVQRFYVFDVVKMSKRIPTTLSPKEVDNFLQRNYSLSLYHFTYSLVDVLLEKDYRAMKVKESRFLELSWRDFWLERKKELKKLKKYNKESLKILKEFSNKTDKYLKSFYQCYLQVWDQNLLIVDISQRKEDLIKHIEKYFLSLAEKRGISPKKTNILFLVWSHFIRNEKVVHVITLLDLLEWFSSRIRKIELEKDYFSIQKYTKELNRYRKGKFKSLEGIVESYKERFLVPVHYHWLEEFISEVKDELDLPLIVFSNNEKFSLRDCLDNNDSYQKIRLKKEGNLCFKLFDFRKPRPEDAPVFFNEEEFEGVPYDVIILTLDGEKER